MQQGVLRRRRRRRDCIEEDRASVGGLDAVDLICGTARKGAPSVVEQFRRHQRLEDRLVVDGHEGLVRTDAIVMDRTGEGFLAVVGLAAR